MTPGEMEVLKTLVNENGFTDVVSSLAEIARNFGDDPDTDEFNRDGLEEINQLLDQAADQISEREGNDDHDQHDVLEDLEERESFSRRKKR